MEHSGPLSISSMTMRSPAAAKGLLPHDLIDRFERILRAIADGDALALGQPGGFDHAGPSRIFTNSSAA